MNAMRIKEKRISSNYKSHNEAIYAFRTAASKSILLHFTVIKETFATSTYLLSQTFQRTALNHFPLTF